MPGLFISLIGDSFEDGNTIPRVSMVITKLAQPRSGTVTEA